MAALLFRWMLRLYPAGWRAEFGEEMASVIQQRYAPARRKLWFCLRECAGIVRGALREWNRRALASPEPWLRSLEAPLLVFVLYRLGFHIGTDLRVHGLLFFPGSYLLIAVLCGGAAWFVGGNCTLFQRRRLRLTVIAAVVCLVGIPFAVKSTEWAWIHHLQDTGGHFHYGLPGIEVTIESHDPGGEPLPPGRNWTEFWQRPDGRSLFIRHSTGRGTPPYGWLAGFVFMSVGLYARRTGRKNLSA